MYKVEDYVQNLRAFQVTEINKIDCLPLEGVRHKKPLKLISLNGFLYVPLHSYGTSLTVYK